jgi:hypothetical protein
MKLEENKKYETIVKNGKLILLLDNRRAIILRSATFQYNEELGYMCEDSREDSCEFSDTVFLNSGICVCKQKLLKNDLT